MSDLEKATAALGEAPELNDAPPAVSELDTLKARADQVGLSYHPNIGVDTLRKKINEFLTGEVEQPDPEITSSADRALAAAMTAPAQAQSAPVQAHRAVTLQEPAAAHRTAVGRYVSPKAFADEKQLPRGENESLQEFRLRKRNHAMALIRVNVTCMNPAKREWDGEIFTTGNALVGSISKYVPFNSEDGWHIPRILYNFLRDRECQVFVTVTDQRQNKIRKGKMIKEFNIEVLEPLTPQELQELKERQALARSVE